MEKNQIFSLIFCFFFMQVSTDSCGQDLCYCDNAQVTCISVINPVFIRDYEIIQVYMENVQILGLSNVLKSFPNLKYLTLYNMLYFNCDWVNDIPSNVYRNIPQCRSDPGKKKIFNVIYS